MLGVDERAAPCNGRREFKDTALLAADQTSLPRTIVPMLQRVPADETDIHIAPASTSRAELPDD